MPPVWQQCAAGGPLLCFDGAPFHNLRCPARAAAWPASTTGDAILIHSRLGGQSVQALNGGAPANHGIAASNSVQYADQAEIDALPPAALPL
jgi:predicted 3-demethylubiquinone-9 3-methyltransferase (glyoxalase superfamily)